MVRFIAVCIAVTAVFILGIPVLQVGAVFNAGTQEPSTSDVQQAANEPQEDPFALFNDTEPSADSLSQIAPAAGDMGDKINQDGFGAYFDIQQHPSFLDHVEEPSIEDISL